MSGATEKGDGLGINGGAQDARNASLGPGTIMFFLLFETCKFLYIYIYFINIYLQIRPSALPHPSRTNSGPNTHRIWPE